MAQSDFYGGDKRAYINEVINPMYYPEGQAVTLTEKHVELWLSPFLEYVEEGKQNFAPQFWGEKAYAIVVNDYIDNYSSLSDVLAAIHTNKEGATNFLDRLNVARTYSTYCPAIIGYDPVNDGYFRSMAVGIGGALSYSSNVRNSSFVPFSNPAEIRYYLYFNENTSTIALGYDASGNEDSTDSTHTATTLGGSPNWFNSFDTRLTEGLSNIKIYLVIRNNNPNGNPPHYVLNWLIVSVENDYFHLSTDYLVCYGVPTNEGEGDEPDVPIPIPDLPTLDISNAGVRLFKAGNFNSLFDYMWGTGNPLDAVYKLIGDETPYECIIAFNLVPYGEAFPTGNTDNIYIGNVNTGLTAPRTDQFGAIDFGTYPITRYFNNALDFSPYTTIELFLPFIGRVKLPTDFVMGKTIGVTYHMDCLTGGCCAFITTTTDGVIQCEGGSCLIQLPISAKTGVGARDAISAAMGAGLSFGMAGGMAHKSGAAAGSTFMGGISGGISQTFEAFSAKDSYTSFGGLSLANGYLGLSNPILYIHRPIDATPQHYNNYIGYAASTERTLTGLSGFTRVQSIQLGIAGASREDLEEIEMLLKEGVIL